MKIVNSKFYQVLEKITNYFFLNAIWLLVSLPIVTLFPATAAMFAVQRGWIRKTDNRVFGSFLEHFKRNFKHSFFYGLLWIAFVAILLIDLEIVAEFDQTINFIMTAILLSIGMVIAFNTAYIFPIMVHYDLSFKGKIKQAFMYSLMYFPTTILCILIGLVTILSVLFLPPLMFISFSVGSYLVLRLCLRTFRKVEEKISKSAE